MANSRYDRFTVTKRIEFGKEVIEVGSVGQEIKVNSTKAAKFTVCGHTGSFIMGRPEFLRKTTVANL